MSFRKVSDMKVMPIYALQQNCRGLRLYENYGKGCYLHSSDIQEDCHLAWF